MNKEDIADQINNSLMSYKGFNESVYDASFYLEQKAAEYAKNEALHFANWYVEHCLEGNYADVMLTAEYCKYTLDEIYDIFKKQSL